MKQPAADFPAECISSFCWWHSQIKYPAERPWLGPFENRTEGWDFVRFTSLIAAGILPPSSVTVPFGRGCCSESHSGTKTSFCSLLCFASCRFCKQLRAAFKDSVGTLFGTALVSRADRPFVRPLMHSLNQILSHVCSIFTEKRRRVQSARPSSADRCSRRPGQRWYHPSQLSSRSRLLAGLSARYCQ